MIKTYIWYYFALQYHTYFEHDKRIGIDGILIRISVKSSTGWQSKSRLIMIYTETWLSEPPGLYRKPQDYLFFSGTTEVNCKIEGTYFDV